MRTEDAITDFHGARRRAAALLLALVALGAGLLAAGRAEARQAGVGNDGRPNILVVMTDDMALTDVKQMPKVRKLLARRGTSFANAINSFPLCCPSRATLLTGQYAHNHQVIGNFFPYGWYGMGRRNNILPAWLDKAGYETGFTGKWLNGYGSLDGKGEIPAGWDEWHGLLDLSAYDYHNFIMNRNGRLRAWGDAEFARKLVEFSNIQVTAPDMKTPAMIYGKLFEVMGNPPYDYWGQEDPKDYTNDVTGRIATKLVRRQRGSKKPFFVWWAPAAPHREDVATTLMDRPGPDPGPPERYEEWSQGLEMPRTPSFNEADLTDKPSTLTSKAPVMSQGQIDQLELDYQGRIGSLRSVDDGVGKLVKALRRTGQLRNTMIVFMSDNGWLHGEHRVTGDKFLPYEESLKSPLILRGPGVPKGRTIKGQVANIDLAPTIVDLAKARPGRTMDGVSLMPAIKRPKRLPNRAFEIEAPRPLFSGPIPNNAWDRPYKGVRTDRYTYVLWPETSEEELYDRSTDPFQLQNLAADPAFAAIKARLAAKLVTLDGCRGRSCLVKP